jgi:hypothetical protein
MAWWGLSVIFLSWRIFMRLYAAVCWVSDVYTTPNLTTRHLAAAIFAVERVNPG